MYRHGDLLLTSVSELPNATTAMPAEPDGSLVLARGEVTGHAHRVLGAGAELRRQGATTYLVLPAGGSLTHEEHGRIDLPPGDYTVLRQREYTPAEIQRVAD